MRWHHDGSVGAGRDGRVTARHACEADGLCERAAWERLRLLEPCLYRRYQDCLALELLPDLQTAETELGGNISFNSACCSH